MNGVRVAGTAALVVLVAVGVCACVEQSGMTREQADALLAEVRDLKQQVAALKSAPGARPAAAAAPAAPPGPGPGPVTVSVEGAYSLGDAKAPVVLVEFTDFQCPYCGRHHLNTWPEIKKNYVDTGKLRYAIKDLPLPMHQNAQSAAEAARCAGALGGAGAYFGMVDALFANQGALGAQTYARLAAGLKLDATAFAKCQASGQFRQAIARDAAEAQAAGIDGTPGFVVGRPHDTSVTGNRLVGAQPYAAFRQALEAPPPAAAGGH